MLERLSTRTRILALVIGSILPISASSVYIALLGCEQGSLPLIYNLAAIVFSTTCVAALAWRGAERLVLTPIRVMLDTTRRIRSGDLAARTGLKPTREELSELGAALDAMAAQLQDRECDLQAAVRALSRQAMTDALTGLYNRRFFWDALARESASAKRKGTPFSVMLVDLDHFKTVNDTWGHDAGDLVLREVASVLGKSVRESDIAVRYGGEEFAILLPGTAADVAAQRAESLRRELERHVITYGAQRVPVTASLGVAQYGSALDAAALMKAVDAAMYAAKAAGRNRVVVGERHTPPREAAIGSAEARLADVG